jgi:serine protease Do
MPSMRRIASVPVLALCSILLVACGNDDPKSPTQAAPVSTVADGGSTTVAAAAGAVSSIEGVKSATVQILVQGEIRDPAEGQAGFASTGSGFFIDADGTIVTNNHVVTGAGSVTVRIGGDRTQEFPAKVLGVSECSDLAVIKMVDPGPYPFLTWSAKQVVPPLEIYATGFPLGDPEYTVTRGVVSKAKAAGDTNWASVRHVIEHDANIQPGNSGGPLVDGEGRLVGVNYAGGDTRNTGTAQFFAIAGDLAKPTIDQLKSGDVDSIGVNGVAFIDREASLSGIWVRGVAPGGPASNAGVKPGDVMVTLNGVDLGGGTYAQYCKVLRSARANTPISVRIVRFDSKEVLEGELNGKELKPVFSFAQELSSDVPTGEPGSSQTSTQYRRITDETGRLTVEIPTNWTDVNLKQQDFLGLGTPQPTLTAAPSYPAFDAGEGPGMGMILMEGAGIGALDKDQLLDAVEGGLDCQGAQRADFADDRFSGRYLTAKCEKTLAVVAIVSRPGDQNKALLVIAQAASEADLEAIDRVLSTFDAR